MQTIVEMVLIMISTGVLLYLKPKRKEQVGVLSVLISLGVCVAV